MDVLQKEKDIKLAALIGQQLLSKNQILQLNHAELEKLFTETQDEVSGFYLWVICGLDLKDSPVDLVGAITARTIDEQRDFALFA